MDTQLLCAANSPIFQLGEKAFFHIIQGALKLPIYLISKILFSETHKGAHYPSVYLEKFRDINSIKIPLCGKEARKIVSKCHFVFSIPFTGSGVNLHINR